MKELPYFKFYVNEWLSGDIELLSFEAQGVFIRLCSYYWSKECVMKLERSKKRFKGFEDAFDELIDEGIIKVEDDYIKISFLDAQLNERESLSKTNSANGKKGGRPKKKPIESEEKPIALNSESESKPNEKPIESESKANKSNIEERREEEKREEEKKEEYYYIINDKLKLPNEKYKKLLETYTPSEVDAKIFELENYDPKKRSKYKSMYLTLNRFLLKDRKEQESKQKEAPKKEEHKVIRDATF